MPLNIRDNMNILLIEDSDLDAELLKRGLHKLGINGTLVRAKDGVDALELLVNDIETGALPHPFITLLDINMPRMNGHEFLEKLRANSMLQHMQVLVFTTSDAPADVMQAHQSNAAGYLVKPNSSAELREILGTVEKFWNTCEHPARVPF